MAHADGRLDPAGDATPADGAGATAAAAAGEAPFVPVQGTVEADGGMAASKSRVV